MMTDFEAALTEEQAAFYEAQGYLKYGNVLTMAEVVELRAALDRIVAEESAGGNDSSPEFRTGHLRKDDPKPDEKPMYEQYVNVWKRQPSFARIIREPRITSVAQALLRTSSVRLWHDHTINKPPRESGLFHFHQDFYGWPLSDPRLVTCWMALDDATVDNGCMHVMPGSHRDTRFAPDVWQRDRELSEQDPTYRSAREEVAELPARAGHPVELRTGECMFHHCLNFHATPPNRTDRQRRAFVIIFMADGVRYQKDRSPTHPLVPLVTVEDGTPILGEDFPIVAA